MPPLDELLQQAVGFHQAGQWTPAEQLYREILQTDPEHAEALQLLGALALQMGHSEAAVAYIQRAIGRGAGSAFVYHNLGQASRACYERVLCLEPGDADATYYLALVLQSLGRLNEARGAQLV